MIGLLSIVPNPRVREEGRGPSSSFSVPRRNGRKKSQGLPHRGGVADRAEAIRFQLASRQTFPRVGRGAYLPTGREGVSALHWNPISGRKRISTQYVEIAIAFSESNFWRRIRFHTFGTFGRDFRPSGVPGPTEAWQDWMSVYALRATTERVSRSVRLPGQR